MKLKDVFKLRDHLCCKLFLLEIVTAFDYATNKAEILSLRQTSILGLFCNFLANFLVAHLAKETLRLDRDLNRSFCLLFTQET